MPRIVIFFFFLICLFLSSTHVFAQGKIGDFLDFHLEGEKVKAKDIRGVLSNIASVYKVPIGFEPKLRLRNADKQAYKLPKGVNEVRVSIPKDGTLREVLNELIFLNPDYEWECINGVVNVFPLCNRDGIVRELLEIRIRHATFEKSFGVMDAGTSISEIPEVKDRFKTLGLTDIHFYYANEVINPKRKDTLKVFTFENTTVRQILNRIVMETASNYWTMTRWGNDGEFITITTS